MESVSEVALADLVLLLGTMLCSAVVSYVVLCCIVDCTFVWKGTVLGESAVRVVARLLPK